MSSSESAATDGNHDILCCMLGFFSATMCFFQAKSKTKTVSEQHTKIEQKEDVKTTAEHDVTSPSRPKSHREASAALQAHIKQQRKRQHEAKLRGRSPLVDVVDEYWSAHKESTRADVDTKAVALLEAKADVEPAYKKVRSCVCSRFDSWCRLSNSFSHMTARQWLSLNGFAID